jgi:hypothetical protein
MDIVDRIKQLLREGNRRRIVVAHEERTVAQFPLTIGVIAAIVAPPLAAIAIVIALVTESSVKVERVDSGEQHEAEHDSPPAGMMAG